VGGDITYLWTAQGWVCWAALLDGQARPVSGWAMSRSIGAALVQAALRMALGRRGPAPGLMHHADRGSPYACDAYQELRAAHGMRCRIGRTGDGLDHAVVARYLGSVTGECTALCHYATRQEARDGGIAASEMFDNSTQTDFRKPLSRINRNVPPESSNTR
jgi:transposase InsO family protein